MNVPSGLHLHLPYRCMILLLITLSAFCSATSSKVNAATKVKDVTQFGIVYALYDDLTATLTDGKNSNDTNPVVLAIINDGGKNYMVTSIGAAAFKGCSRMTDIYLCENIKTIAVDAFEGCNSLVNIYSPAYNPPSLSGTGSLYTTKRIVNVPIGCSEAYKSTGSAFSDFTRVNEVSDEKLGVYRPDFSIKSNELIFKKGEIQSLNISLAYGGKYNALQFDLFLPEGLTIAAGQNGGYDVTINSAPHVVAVNKVRNGSYRFISYSTQNSNFQGNTNLLTVSISVDDSFDEGEIRIENGVVSEIVDQIIYERIPRNRVFNASLPEVPVTSISLNKTELTLKATEKANLSVTYNPSDATGKKVTWTSSDNTVATVSSSGEVTAIAVGRATITATTPNGKTATCSVTVATAPTPATSVAIATPQKTTLNVGETITLSATVFPDLTTDKTVTWSTSDAAVATVDANGKVTAKGPGTVTITATCGTVSDKVTFTVPKLVTSITLSNTSLSLERGKEVTLTATYLPANPDRISLKWSSSNNNVATVTDKGVVKAITPGNAIITITDSESGVSASCNLTVTEILYGDANNDGSITINDAVLIVNYILEMEPAGFVVDRADVDRNGRVNVTDVSRTIELVLAQPPESVSLARQSMITRAPGDNLTVGDIKYENNGLVTIPISLSSGVKLTAIQSDVKIPEGLAVNGVISGSLLSSDHMIETKKIDDTTFRVIIFSPTLAELNTDNALLSLMLAPSDKSGYFGGGTISISNTIGSLPSGRGVAIDDATIEIGIVSGIETIYDGTSTTVISEATGVRIISPAGATVRIFDLTGKTLHSSLSTGNDTYLLSPGIYIVRVADSINKVIIK